MKETRMYKWIKKLGLPDYNSLYMKSIDDISWFWDEVVKELDIVWTQSYEKTVDLSKGIKYPEWFTSGKMNIVQNAVDKWADRDETKHSRALIWEGEDGTNISYTFEQLSKEISKAAVGLHSLGINKGDVVTLYLPMIPETVIALLAIAKIGAIFSPAFSGYGADAVATRITASGSKVLITADGYYRRGKIIPMKEEADRAAALSPTIEKVIVIERTGRQVPWINGRDMKWAELPKNESSFKTVETNANDPFMLIYTSGTTGKPKGAVHTHAGFPIKSAFDAGICMDVKRGDTLFWFTDMGWMMGPFLVFGGLVNGASILLYEGTPDFPEPDRIWQLISNHKVTQLGISPTLVRSLMKYGTEWVNKHDLSCLRAIGSTGEPWNPEPWMWLFEKVGKRLIPIMNYSGGTEISGGILGNVLLKPISPITFNSPIPGMDVHVYDENGSSVINQVGELVILKPFVGMTNGFWNENDRYESTYWERWPDTWVHGDWVIKDEQGFWTITGRSDDILNVAGKRLGPAELESALVEHPLVIEAATIGIPDNVKGETGVCFVVLTPGSNGNESLKKELYQLVVKHLGKSLQPQEIYFISELPKTRNGKVMRRVIKSAYLNQPSGDVSSLENPDSVEAIRALQEGKASW
ncbi:AMP-binding protein [Peribacillus glennii]|uniref:acetate--CoA ligase n=1 Tax=Peribacillus glennii TaxID=2303991 RepID=A0A372L807_9BACI|nr:AMP-binding protein [Peribacillus glennii]RFU60927.1 AMP-dependent synthetase [Peribacillus glennii]